MHDCCNFISEIQIFTAFASVLFCKTDLLLQILVLYLAKFYYRVCSFYSQFSSACCCVYELSVYQSINRYNGTFISVLHWKPHKGC